MSTKSVSRYLLSLLFVLTVTFSSVQPVSASGPAPTRSQARFEVRFMKDMINHHAGGVEMAQLCVERAIHGPLRALCRGIITEQTHDIELMQSWLQTWYTISHIPRVESQSRKMINELKRLEREEFEIRFMQLMIRHHKMAIQMSERCLDRAHHENLLGLCKKTIKMSMEEIEQMQTWLCEWYQRCSEDN